MTKKLILFSISFVLFSSFHLAHADVIINEVELSPTAERFIELYNDGNDAVDLTGWYMQRKTATSASFGSLASKTNFEGKTINSHDYFVISKNDLGSSDIVLDSLTLTESNTIQIKNGSQDVVDKVGWGDGCEGSCASNPPEGKSIQKDGGSFVVATPTPGETNQTSDSSADSNNDTNDADTNNSGNDSATTNESKPKVVVVPTMKAKIIASSVVFAGQPFEIKTDVFGYSNENIVLGRANWNFGDGDSSVQVNDFGKFYHTYFYPGEYVVFLEYYLKSSSMVPEATSKMIIKVLPTTVVISKIGNVEDFFVELSNNAGSDIDVSNWVLNANGKIFIFPKNSVIMSKRKMAISSRITGFTYADRYGLKLLSSTGELISDYLFLKTTVKNKVTDQSLSAKDMVSDLQEEEMSDEDLLASVVNSETEEDNTMRTYFLTTIMTVFLGGSAGAVYFIRKKKIIPVAGDDFKILDE